MKASKMITPVMLLLLVPLLAASQEVKKTEVIYIQTSAICGDCKERIESALMETKGVKVATMNMADKKVMVKYQPSKVTQEGLRQVIASVGYDADEVKANEEAYSKLPKCCQKDAQPH